MSEDLNENGGQAVLEDGCIVIRITVEALPMILEGAWATNNLTRRYKIINTQEFANDLICELNAESEDGSTRIHHMFDKAIEGAIDQGAFGVEEHKKQEHE